MRTARTLQLAPDNVMPGQFNTQPRRSPETNLVMEVIASAIHDIASPASHAHEREAIAWVKQASPEVMGFRWCCEVANLPCERLQRAILERARTMRPVVHRMRYEKRFLRRTAGIFG